MNNKKVLFVLLIFSIYFFSSEFRASSESLGSSYIPPAPDLTSTQGNFWINYTWQAGNENIATDSYNVSINGDWNNGTTITYSNKTVGPHGWSNISVWAYNNSGSGALSQTPASQSIQVANNAPVQTSIGNKAVTAGQLLTFTVSATDADSDTITYGTNAIKGTLNSSTGVYSWQTSSNDIGTYTWDFSSGDSYGGVASETIIVTVVPEPRYSVSGYVFDNYGSGLKDVLVQSGDNKSATSASGYYLINDLLNGTYKFSYSKAGFDTGYLDLTISGADVINANKTISDTTPPPSIANPSTATGNFFINNTWVNPVDTNFDHVWFRYSNGTTLQNIGSSINYLNLVWSPHYTQNISAQTVDTYGNTNPERIWFNTTIPNNIPVQALIGNKAVTAGQVLSFTVSATDADSDPITYGTNAIKGTLNPSTGVYSWIPGSGDVGMYTWTFSSSDNYGGVASETITVTVNPPPTYIPPAPANLASVQGNFWINYSWQAGDGNITDSYNVSVNGIWTNGTTNTYSNTSVGPHGWSNIIIWAYNSSDSGRLSLTSISQSTQVFNNPPIQSHIGDKEIYKGQLLTFSISATDADSDHITYGTNATKGSLNNETGVFTWAPGDNDEGTYRWEFNSSDGYGGVANETIWITVKNPLETNMNFIEPTIINNNESWVDAKFGHIGKFIGVNGTFENKGNDSLILNITEIYNNESQHWLPFKPLAPNESMSYIQLFGRPAFEINSTGVDEELKVFNFTLVINVTGQNGSIFYINTTTISLSIYPIFKIKRADGFMVVVGEGSTTPVTYILEANSSINLTNVSINDYNPSTPNNHSKYFGTIEANKPQTISYTYSATTADLSSNKCEESIRGYPCIINLAIFTGEMNGVPIKDTDFVELPVCKETDKNCLQGYTVNRIPNRGSDGNGYRSYSGGGGGGGGGGGIPPSEDYKNIERREVREMDTLAKTASVYVFSAADPVMIVSFESSVSENGVPVSVEVLKNRSKRIGVDAPGKPYKYFNIFAGMSGFSKKISNGVVVYRVNNSWLEENGLDPGDISLYKWQGEWVRKSTEIAESRSNYTYYASLVGNFSSFAIAGVKKQDVTLSSPPAVNNSVSASKIEESTRNNSSLSKSTGFIKSLSQNPELPEIILIFWVIGIIYYLKRNHKIRQEEKKK